jgi:DNA-binding transcriptional regulator YiaG
LFYDPETGEKLFTNTNEKQTRKKTETIIDPETGKKKKVDVLNDKGKPVYEEVDALKTEKTTRMAVTKDAFTLTSGGSKEHPGTLIESVYAAHANRLKGLARKARLSMLKEKDIQYNPSARKTYAKEVSSLDSKLRIAQASAPLERQAWLLASKNVELRLRERPDIKDDPDALKKLKGQALRNARLRVGSAKTRIDITDDEWKAIQSGAVTKTKLKAIFRNTDADKLKQRAMPRTWKGMSPNRIATAKRMLKNGHTQAEVAEALGVSVSTLERAIKK